MPPNFIPKDNDAFVDVCSRGPFCMAFSQLTCCNSSYAQVTYLSCEDGEVALMLEQPEKSFDQLPSHSALLPQTYNIGQHIHQGHFTSAAKDKKHQCSVCGASFVLKGNLRLHLVTHTGERPFMCSVCQKTFNRKNNMERHMTMIHRMSITQKKT